MSRVLFAFPVIYNGYVNCEKLESSHHPFNSIYHKKDPKCKVISGSKHIHTPCPWTLVVFSVNNINVLRNN